METLLNSLPALLHETRTQQIQQAQRNQRAQWVRIAVPHSLDPGRNEPASTKELLEVAVQLTADITEALDEMSEGKESPPVEESLRELYKKEVATLLKWKAANGAKMGGKLSSQNKSVWEALEATVFNMTDLLSKFIPIVSNHGLTFSRLYLKPGQSN